MKTIRKFQCGSLTIYSADRSSIVGELTDAEWIEEIMEGGVNYVLKGTASEGTLDTILSLLQAGVVTVAYDFFADSQLFRGTALMLRPGPANPPASATITIASPDRPRAVGQVGVSGARAL